GRMSLFSTLGGSGGVRAGRTSMPLFDGTLIIVCLSLVLFGLLMVYSASIALADGPRYEAYGRFYCVIRHGVFIAIGLVSALIALTVPMKVWEQLAMPLFLSCVLLLVIVLIPGIGREVNGARRWLPLGIVNFQPSELMKVAVVLFAADYTV